MLGPEAMALELWLLGAVALADQRISRRPPV